MENEELRMALIQFSFIIPFDDGISFSIFHSTFFIQIVEVSFFP